MTVVARAALLLLCTATLLAGGAGRPASASESLRALADRLAQLEPAKRQEWLLSVEVRLAWATSLTMPPEQAARRGTRARALLRQKTIPKTALLALVKELDAVERAAIDRLQRQYRTQTYRSFREQRAILDQRQQAWHRVYAAWKAAGRPFAQQDRLIEWLEAAIRSSTPEHLGPLPEAPTFGPQADTLGAIGEGEPVVEVQPVPQPDAEPAPSLDAAPLGAGAVTRRELQGGLAPAGDVTPRGGPTRTIVPPPGDFAAPSQVPGVLSARGAATAISDLTLLWRPFSRRSDIRFVPKVPQPDHFASPRSRAEWTLVFGAVPAASFAAYRQQQGTLAPTRAVTPRAKPGRAIKPLEADLSSTVAYFDVLPCQAPVTASCKMVPPWKRSEGPRTPLPAIRFRQPHDTARPPAERFELLPSPARDPLRVLLTAWTIGAARGREPFMRAAMPASAMVFAWPQRAIPREPVPLVRVNVDTLSAIVAGTNLGLRALEAGLDEPGWWDAARLAPLVERLNVLAVRQGDQQVLCAMLTDWERARVGRMEPLRPVVSRLAGRIAEARSQATGADFPGTEARRRAELEQLDELSRTLAELAAGGMTKSE